MTEKEKLELKLEIFKEIKDCMKFDFTIIHDSLDGNKIDYKINEYEILLEEMNKNEVND